MHTQSCCVIWLLYLLIHAVRTNSWESDWSLSKNLEGNSKEGEKNYFGNICNFEKAHLEPHILNGDNTCGYQCKWCNTFYKDKIIWNKENQKPKFNIYAILRDGPKSQIIKHLKSLGFTSKDLE